MVLLPCDLFARAISRDIIPTHITPVDHAAQREPVFEPPLVLNPDMLVMPVVLVIDLREVRRHGADGIGGIMPDKTLEDLVTPSEAQLATPVGIRFFILREGTQARHASEQKYVKQSFHAAKI